VQIGDEDQAFTPGGMGIIPESTGLVWFTSGAIPPQGTFDYWASPMTIFWVNMCLMNFAEIKRGLANGDVYA